MSTTHVGGPGWRKRNNKDGTRQARQHQKKGKDAEQFETIKATREEMLGTENGFGKVRFHMRQAISGRMTRAERRRKGGKGLGKGRERDRNTKVQAKPNDWRTQAGGQKNKERCNNERKGTAASEDTEKTGGESTNNSFELRDAWNGKANTGPGGKRGKKESGKPQTTTTAVLRVSTQEKEVGSPKGKKATAQQVGREHTPTRPAQTTLTGEDNKQGKRRKGETETGKKNI